MTPVLYMPNGPCFPAPGLLPPPAAVLLIVQFGLGMGVNLYLTLPARESFLPAVFSSALLAVHAIVALATAAAMFCYLAAICSLR